MFTSLRVLRSGTLNAAPSRYFATTSRARDGFADLAAITSAAPSKTFQVTTVNTEEAAPTRGYLPGALAPKNDPVLDLFTKLLMKSGKIGAAERQMTSVLTLLQQVTNQPPLPLLRDAVNRAAPSVRVSSFTKGAKTILMPKALNERQRTRQGITWILDAAKKSKRGTMSDRIVREIVSVLEGQSSVYQKVDDVHKNAMLARSNLISR